MKNPLAGIKDRDLRGSWPAMQRAAQAARKLAEQTGTPLYVMRRGRVVNALATKSCRRMARS
jgi:hypothetical protein